MIFYLDFNFVGTEKLCFDETITFSHTEIFAIRFSRNLPETALNLELWSKLFCLIS